MKYSSTVFSSTAKVMKPSPASYALVLAGLGVDGLVLHCVVRPDRATTELMRDVVERHLAELVRGSSAESVPEL